VQNLSLTVAHTSLQYILN